MSYQTRSGRMGQLVSIGTLNMPIITMALVLGLVGVMMLYSVAGGDFSPWAWRHASRLAVGLLLMYAIANLDLRTIFNAAYPIYGVIFLLLAAVAVFGNSGMGAQRWLDLGFVTLQPSEFMRFAVIMALARYYHTLHRDDVSQPFGLIVPIGIIGIPALLIFAQPDLGTAIMLAVSGLGVVFLAGVSMRYFIAGIAVTIAAVPVVWNYLYDYQKERVLVFLDPERDPLGAGYHIIQSKIGIGSGGLFGKGIAQGTQSQLKFLPERHTDFVFAIYAEELGFMGSLLLIFLFAILIFLMFTIAAQMRHRFSQLTIAGFAFALSIYVIVNLAMVMGLAPVVGVPLPFISYGGTSLLTFMAGLGVILALERQPMAELPK
ncbi:MAG: Peptidoglycan glycosyltransferase MrdB [Alphaproteobacteria bacterium]|nr:MAG: Peptidoglycan glycosyltransferase MrdB [Alphaproteobacteria bacterium]